MRLYIKYISIHLKSQMQYKASFSNDCRTVTSILHCPLGLYFMMDRFKTVGVLLWNRVLLCFAVVLMAFSLAECFARGLIYFPR